MCIFGEGGGGFDKLPLAENKIMQFPIRHNNHTLEQKSETFVRKYLPQDWNVTKPNNDYGQDLNIEICEECQYRGLDLIVQLKSSLSADSLDEIERQQLKVSTYNYLMGNLRVAMLIKYVEDEDEAYWILLKDVSLPKTFEQENFTVQIPRENKVSNIEWSNITNYVRCVTDDKLKISRLAENLQKVKQELEDTKSEFIIEKEILTHLHTNLLVSFSGEWDNEPYPSQLLSPVNDQWFVIFQSKKGLPEIKFYATETYNFQTISMGHAKFSCRQAIKVGDYPLGENQNTLMDYQIISILIPFILYENIKNSKITVNEIKIEVVFNGKIKKIILINQSCEVEVKIYNNNKANAWAILSFGSDNENENIFNYFSEQ